MLPSPPCDSCEHLGEPVQDDNQLQVLRIARPYYDEALSVGRYVIIGMIRPSRAKTPDGGSTAEQFRPSSGPPSVFAR